MRKSYKRTTCKNPAFNVVETVGHAIVCTWINLNSPFMTRWLVGSATSLGWAFAATLLESTIEKLIAIYNNVGTNMKSDQINQ
jgi:hypothetical protein